MRCPRCGTVLQTGHRSALDSLIALSISMVVLMGVALSLPFLSLSGGGLSKDASVIDAAAAIADNRFWPFAVAVGALIFAVPVLRALALAYVLVPLRLGFGPPRQARWVFRMALELRPWSMAEIFLIGVAVALVKIADLATLSLGPAFWLFVVLSVMAIAEDMLICRRSIWRLLE